MNTPLDFPLAKLLIQKKGFDNKCHNYWNRTSYSGEWFVDDYIHSDSIDSFYAPTIADAVMWLCEHYKMWVYAVPLSIDAPLNWFWKIDSVTGGYLDYATVGFATPREAYQAAIRRILEDKELSILN